MTSGAHESSPLYWFRAACCHGIVGAVQGFGKVTGHGELYGMAASPALTRVQATFTKEIRGCSKRFGTIVYPFFALLQFAIHASHLQNSTKYLRTNKSASRSVSSPQFARSQPVVDLLFRTTIWTRRRNSAATNLSGSGVFAGVLQVVHTNFKFIFN